MGIVGTIIFVIIALIIIAATGGYVVSMYNSLIQVRNNIDKAW